MKKYKFTTAVPREMFEYVRSQTNTFSLRLRMTLVVCCELLFSAVLALVVSALLDQYFSSYLLFGVTLTVTCLVVGSVVTALLSKMFFDPVKKVVMGMERVAEAHVMAMEKAMEMELQNVRDIIMDAEWLDKSFAPGELDGIFLNFSDPWPSTRHAHRRLTHRNFLSRYARALKPGGKLCFKTDNAGLFEFSVKEFERNGWRLSEVTRDLHHDGIVGIMTGYEEKFHAQGIPICRLEAVYEGAAHDSHSDC